jgi:hypothetical protein
MHHEYVLAPVCSMTTAECGTSYKSPFSWPYSNKRSSPSTLHMVTCPW